MVAFGYQIFLVRASRPHRPTELLRLDSVGDDRQCVNELVFEMLEGLGVGYHRIEGESEGYRVKELQRYGQSIWLRINKGPEGREGETYDTETGESVLTSERKALLSGLRAAFYFPANSYYGALFVERAGGRTLKDLLYRVAIRPAAVQVAATIRVESFAETDDWRRDLAGKSVLRISEVSTARSTSDDASTATDTLVHLSVEGGLVHRVSGLAKDVILEKAATRERRLDLAVEKSQLLERKAVDGRGFTAQDEAELRRLSEEIQGLGQPTEALQRLRDELPGVTPVPTADLEHQRYDVTMGEGRFGRNFSIERDTVPAFIYELGGYLTPSALRQLWNTHAERIFQHRHVALQSRWLDNSRRGT